MPVLQTNLAVHPRPKSTKVRPVTEFELIAQLKPGLTTNDFVVVGAGDDCAVLELGSGVYQTLLKTDAVVEGIHFTRDTAPERIGNKALGRCLSDIAAMGGRPIAALVTLCLPKNYDPDRVFGLYRGMNRLAARYQVAIVGGETTTSPDTFIVSVTLLGSVPSGTAVLRSGARPGDAIFVTGELGGSIEGKHLDFEPRVLEGAWLAQTGLIHAMMDLSDGLAGDLPHLLTASGGLGAELHASAIPLSHAAKVRAKSGDLAKPALASALTDGEDFELLVVVPSRNAVQLLDQWKARFPTTRLSCIGRITEQPGIKLRDARGVRLLAARGYEHFRDE